MEQNQLTPFAFGDNLVRVLSDESGEPWFVAKDVARALGYEWNGNACIAHVPDEWKGVRTVLTPRGEQGMLTLSEPGLYFFLGRSDKPGALPFQKWLAGEVLPAIRKTGSYAMPGRAPSRREPLPEDLPPSALGLKPSMRQRLWRDALDTVRLEGGDIAMALTWFDKLCRLMTCQGPLPPGVEPTVGRFFTECCEKCPGERVSAAKFYDALRAWCRLHGLDLPGRKTVGQSMCLLCDVIRSDGSWYADIRLH